MISKKTVEQLKAAVANAKDLIYVKIIRTDYGLDYTVYSSTDQKKLNRKLTKAMIKTYAKIGFHNFNGVDYNFTSAFTQVIPILFNGKCLAFYVFGLKRYVSENFDTLIAMANEKFADINTDNGADLDTVLEQLMDTDYDQITIPTAGKETRTPDSKVKKSESNTAVFNTYDISVDNVTLANVVKKFISANFGCRKYSKSNKNKTDNTNYNHEYYIEHKFYYKIYNKLYNITPCWYQGLKLPRIKLAQLLKSKGVSHPYTAAGQYVIKDIQELLTVFAKVA